LKNKRKKLINIKIFMCQFVQNFPSYVYARYYLESFTVGKVITKINE